MPVKLFVGGLSFSTSTDRLRETFARFGSVTSAAVMNDRETGRSRGFGFVEMATPEEADQAISRLNGSSLDGRTIRVDKATPRGTGGGGPYRGGDRRGGFGERRPEGQPGAGFGQRRGPDIGGRGDAPPPGFGAPAPRRGGFGERGPGAGPGGPRDGGSQRRGGRTEWRPGGEQRRGTGGRPQRKGGLGNQGGGGRGRRSSRDDDGGYRWGR
jgi:RNA recognition motif-containing protein